MVGSLYVVLCNNRKLHPKCLLHDLLSNLEVKALGACRCDIVCIWRDFGMVFFSLTKDLESGLFTSRWWPQLLVPVLLTYT